MMVSFQLTVVSIFFKDQLKSQIFLYQISYEKFQVICPFQSDEQDILIDILLIIKMYNSEEVYTFEEGKQSQSNQPDVESHKNQRINNSRPKNIISAAQKVSGISGTYSRIVPKKPLHDFQRLYAENIQLREKIRFLEQSNTKIKTRVSMAQKQKEQLISQICHMDNNISLMKERRPSQHSFQKNQQKPKKVILDQNRRILHQYKDEISKLKLQNGRLKKTVKYTQIQQLQTQNKSLHEQMARMKQYMQDIINSTQYDQYQRQIEALNQQLQGQKSAVKNMTVQLKKKDQQMEQVKNKMKVLATRKTELQKKYTRDINNVKGQLHRVKQKQKQIITMQQDKKQTSKTQKITKNSECKQCSNLKQNNTQQKDLNKKLEQKLATKQTQISQLKNKIQQLQKQTISNKKQEKNQNKIEVQNDKKQQNRKKIEQNHQKQQKNKNHSQQKKQKQKQSPKTSNTKQMKKQVQKQDHNKKPNMIQQDQYGEFDEDEDQQEKQYNTQNNIEHSSDKVDVFHVDLQSDRKNQNQTKKLSDKKKQKTEENYQQYDQSYNDKGFEQIQKQFKDNQSDQQVLFQKQQKPKSKQKSKKKSESTKKQKKSVKQQRQSKQKQSMPISKIQKILKQTIKYRLMAQRYTYQDFCRDITDSKATQFTVEEIIEMVTNQPFFLNQEHLKMVVCGLYERQQIDVNDVIAAKVFLKKMRQYIGDFDLQEEDQQQEILKQIQKKLAKKKLLSKFKQQANGPSISKKGFVKVLKQIGGFTQPQIQQSLAEASILSLDIAHINYKQFYEKLTKGS